MLPETLASHSISGGLVIPHKPGSWHLEIPTGPANSYRLAEVGDYHKLPRRKLPWQTGLRLRLRARASKPNLPGTWGFGLWNDPFSSFLLGARRRWWPTLPNAVWFFFASPPNHLALRDDLPGYGQLAGTFRSPSWITPLLVMGVPLVPLLAIPAIARLARHFASRIVHQDSADLTLNPCDWHLYQVEWLSRGCKFWVDEQVVFETPISPLPPLGLVIWVDNQYAAFPPDGRINSGTLPNPEPAWIEIEAFEITSARGNQEVSL